MDPGDPERVAVTGGAGFIGCHTVEALLAEGSRVLVVDDFRHASHRPVPLGAEVVRLDVALPEARRAVAAYRPDAILHLAAQGGVNRSWREPAGDAAANVLGTVSVLQAAVEAGCPRVVLASSGGALYGDTEHLPTPEEEPVAPRSPYGCAKASCEVYLEMFGRAHGVRGTALRYGNVYGPGQDGSGEAGVVAISSLRLARGEPPVIRGDGGQTRDFVYVEDVVEANLRALRADATGAVNVGTGVESGVEAVVSLLIEAAGFGGRAVREPAPPGEVRRSALDTQRARRTLGWSPRTELAQGLRVTYEHFCERARGGSASGPDMPTKEVSAYARDITSPIMERR